MDKLGGISGFLVLQTMSKKIQEFQGTRNIALCSMLWDVILFSDESDGPHQPGPLSQLCCPLDESLDLASREPGSFQQHLTGFLRSCFW